MDENKRAAKEFVDKYFPVIQQPASPNDVLDKAGFTSNSPPEPYKNKQGSAGVQEGESSTRKSRSINPVAFCKVPASCLVGSTVSYGSRDYYCPNPPATRHPGDSYEGKDHRKDGEEYKTPENPRGEWWQGSYNY